MHLERAVQCPKQMVFGPCGGVRAGGRCEVDERECPFIESPAQPWPSNEQNDKSDHGSEQPLILSDFRSPRPRIADARALARQHEGWADMVLLGEHHEQVDLPNVLMAKILLDEGVTPWVTLTCRDRNSVALESDLAALAELGVAGVHCVTGDARAPHVRPGSTPVFDLDSLRLTALATSFGLTVSVAESPLAEPVDRRPMRVADKARAGASWCIVNTGVAPADLDAFVKSARAHGTKIRFAASIPIFTDADGAARLRRLPGVVLGDALVESVLGAHDPVAAGIDRAIREAREALDVDGVQGINLSGPASTRSTEERTAVMRAVTEGLR